MPPTSPWPPPQVVRQGLCRHGRALRGHRVPHRCATGGVGVREGECGRLLAALQACCVSPRSVLSSVASFPAHSLHPTRPTTPQHQSRTAPSTTRATACTLGAPPARSWRTAAAPRPCASAARPLPPSPRSSTASGATERQRTPAPALRRPMQHRTPLVPLRSNRQTFTDRQAEHWGKVTRQDDSEQRDGRLTTNRGADAGQAGWLGELGKVEGYGFGYQ